MTLAALALLERYYGSQPDVAQVRDDRTPVASTGMPLA